MSNESESFLGWPTVLRSLMARTDLSRTNARDAMRQVLAGSTTSAQIAAFVVALRIKGEAVEELVGLLEAMHEVSLPVAIDEAMAVIDTCGTGGDGSHSINVSTLAAIVVAGAGGRVCKHGNRSVSSACGSADVLEALGVAIEVEPEVVARCVQEAGIGFCFAPRFHAAMRHVGPTRRELGVPTVFNFLGPLANPGRVRRQVVGVSDPAMAQRMIEVLGHFGAERAMVVYGHDGLDELTTTTSSTVLERRDGSVRRYEVQPADLGLAVASPGDLVGGDARHNAEVARAVLGGSRGPHRDIVVLNAAAGLVVNAVVDTIGEGVERAQLSLDSGAAADALARLVTLSNQLID